MGQNIIISKQFKSELATAISECENDKTFVLVDETTREKCWELIKDEFCLKQAQVISIGTTDGNKTLDTLAYVWQALQQGGATRHSLLINLGGGMVTDLGGFAASTFKRGINFINIPTTLLAMVDASVGGKTGINFGGLKNEIGVFSDAGFVLLNTEWLRTLDAENIRSGYAEMLKHGLTADEEMWAELVGFNLAQPDLQQLAAMLGKSVRVKERIVEEDPHEKGLRKALNLGHTFGHAFESWSMKRNPVLHGYAVAFGLIAELYLSVVKTGFPIERMRQTVSFIREYYGSLRITCNDYPDLIDFMHHDKKNRGDEINVTLLGAVGDVRIDQSVSEEEVKEALDFMREG
ncbi:3-dehydroquinate synthase [Prevotella fusca]|uniref:3-dehydroquinate synthase n=1 Tax=Prevotella fusca TaxID=589436 RepID=UPI003FA0BA17